MKNLFSNSDIESAARGDGKPIGLKLTKTQSLLKKMNKLSHQPSVDDVASSSSDSRKAVNFPALCLEIGTWKIISEHEGDLIVKCYFKKSQLVWEFLDPKVRTLKKKIEFEWSNISAIRASFLAKAGVLEIKLKNPPKFFREINPEPRKHTNWEVTEDFTSDCQASLVSKHKLKFTPGVFEKYYQHVIRGDSILFELSQRPFPTDDASKYFDEIKFSSNHELSAQDAVNNNSDKQQYLLSQEMAARIEQPKIEPQIWRGGAMDLSGYDVSHNQEESNGHTLIESGNWDEHNMKMLVDAMSISSTPLTTSRMSPVQHDILPFIDDHCYYGNEQSQFTSSSILEGMEFSGHDWSDSLTQFTKSGNYPTHDDTPNNGNSVINNSSHFTSSSLTNHEIPHQQLEKELSDYPLPQDYLMMVAAERSGLLQEPHHQVNYNYGNNWGWLTDYHQSSFDYQQFYNTGIHGCYDDN